MSSANFRIVYDGPALAEHTMDVRDLALIEPCEISGTETMEGPVARATARRIGLRIIAAVEIAGRHARAGFERAGYLLSEGLRAAQHVRDLRLRLFDAIGELERDTAVVGVDPFPQPLASKLLNLHGASLA